MLEGMEPTPKIAPCAVRTLHATLEPGDKAILFDALIDVKAWSHKGLERALLSRGVKISESSLRKHRMAECSCKVGWQDA